MEEEELAIFLVTFTGVANPALVPLARHGGVYAGVHCTSGSLWGRPIPGLVLSLRPRWRPLFFKETYFLHS